MAAVLMKKGPGDPIKKNLAYQTALHKTLMEGSANALNAFRASGERPTPYSGSGTANMKSNLGGKGQVAPAPAQKLNGGTARLMRKSKQNVKTNAASKQAKLSAKKLY